MFYKQPEREYNKKKSIKLYKGEKIIMARYRYFVVDGVRKNGESVKVTVCETHYAGKVVRGRAYCAPADTFDKELGEKIARLRADIKVQEKRISGRKADIRYINEAIRLWQESLAREQKKMLHDAEELERLKDEEKSCYTA